jgi:large subunit ribosomal protein L3
MPGRMGREKTTVQNLRVIKVDPELKVVMVRGAVPGHNNCTLIVKSAVKR